MPKYPATCDFREFSQFLVFFVEMLWMLADAGFVVPVRYQVAWACGAT